MEFCEANSQNLAYSLYRAVVQPIDRGLQEVFQLLKNIPNRENRVIGVITKADRKQEGADDWVGHFRAFPNILLANLADI